MSTVPNRNNWTFGVEGGWLEIPTKDQIAENYIRTMLARTSNMFKYTNLPDTINIRDLEVILQTKGYAVGLKVNDKPYILRGFFAGVLNEQLLPTETIVTNVYLNIDKTLTIGKDCVVIKNDSMYQGLMPMFNKYAALLSETDISLKYACWNSRISMLIECSDDNTKISAEALIQKIIDGKDLGVIAGKPLIESLKTYPYNGNTNNYITNLLELHQYLKANWYIDLGINANYNMKRESLSSNEVAVNEDTLLPLIDDMERCRKEGIESFNKMMGTNIGVELDSSWQKIKQEINMEVESKQKEIEQMEVEIENGKDDSNPNDKEPNKQE